MTTNPAKIDWTPHGDFAPLDPVPSTYMDAIDQMGSDLAAASELITARAALTASGVVDIGPALQAAYDSGDRIISLDPRGSYLWDSAVFPDDTDPHRQRLVIFANGARIILGPNLPTTSVSGVSTFSGVRFAVFPNVKRTALSGGVVTLSDANRATGTNAGAVRSLVIYDAVIDGQSSARGFCYADRTPVTMFNTILDDAEVALTWRDYADCMVLIACSSRGNGNANQRFIHQVDQGDGHVIVSPKADSSVKFGIFNKNHGMNILGVVTGAMEFNDCTNLDIRGAHQEGQQADGTTLTFRRASGDVHGAIYQNATTPAIVVDDSASTNSGSVLNLRIETVQLHTGGDTPRAPFLSITPNRNTRVRADKMRGVLASAAMAGERFDSVQSKITGSAGILAAVGTDAAKAAIARGSWELRATTGDSTFALTDARGLLITSREPSVPVIAQATTDSGVNDTGTLTPGQIYEYAAATIDGRGLFGQTSAAVSATASSKGGVRLLLNLPNAPSRVRLWRKTGTGVLAGGGTMVSVDFEVNGRGTYLIDSGANISGLAVATAVDTPNSVASTNNTLDGVAISTGFIYIESGVWKVRGGSGTVTTIGPA